MNALELAGKWHRHVLPFSLAVRLVSFTTPSSLAAAAEFSPAIREIQFASPLKEDDFLSLTNAARAAQGLAPLTINARLTEAAQRKAMDMASNGYWDHFRPSDHKAPWDFIKESGYSYTVAGENLARGFSTVRGITDAWLASPTHRGNVLSPRYSDVGFASVAVENDEGQKVLLTVQMFGHR